MAHFDEEPGQDERTLGARLRAAREGRRLSLQDIANQTRIPVRHLQHVEQEEWDHLPGVTYCIGFVRAYANAVGLDGADYGREVRDQLGGGGRARAPAAADYYEPADPARVPPRSLAFLAAFVALALIVGYALWRSSQSAVEQPAAPPAMVAPQPSATPQPAAPQAVAGQPVTLVATGEVWVRITDGTSGASLFQGVLASGQRFAVPPAAQRPLLRTGRPQMLRAAVAGRDLGPLDSAERTVSDLSLRAEDLAARQAQAAR